MEGNSFILEVLHNINRRFLFPVQAIQDLIEKLNQAPIETLAVHELRFLAETYARELSGSKKSSGAYKEKYREFFDKAGLDQVKQQSTFDKIEAIKKKKELPFGTIDEWLEE